jgi:hypothetical protein
MRKFIALVLLMAALLVVGCGSAPHVNVAAIERAHLASVCNGLAQAVRDSGNPNPATTELNGLPYITWNNEMNAALLPAVSNVNGAHFTNYLSPNMTRDVANMVTHLDQTMGMAGNPSAAEVGAVQRDCASVGVTAPIWPVAEIG